MVQLTLLCPALMSSSAYAAASWFPKAGDSWNIQLLTVPKATQADNAAYGIWDMDLEDTPKATITAFKNKGKKVICYFSAGSYEDYRDDIDQFPDAAIGNVMEGWEDENWIDVRNDGIREVMRKRIALAKTKGCDGVDPDNIDGYGNDTGFDLTEADAVDYIKFLAQTAHDAGLSFGLKNGGDIVPQVVDVCEWEINEQCALPEYNECAQLQPFIAAGKPVFHIEYVDVDQAKANYVAPANLVKQSCSAKGAQGFSTLIKDGDLTGWTTLCPKAQTSGAKRSHRH